MLVGREKVDEQFTSLAERLEADAEGELVEVVEVIAVAVVRYGVGDDGESDCQALFYRCSSALIHTQIGLLEHAKDAVSATVKTRNEDDA